MHSKKYSHHDTQNYEINVTCIYSWISRKVHMAYILPLFHLHTQKKEKKKVGTTAVETKYAWRKPLISFKAKFHFQTCS